jgi:homoserine kinase
VQELNGMPGILGAVLSGAGPSVLIFLDSLSKTSAKKIAAQVAAYLQRKKLAAELLITSIAGKGGAAARRAKG